MRLLILFVLFTLSANAQSDEYMDLLDTYYRDFPTISCSEAVRLIPDEHTYFLDTREQKEFDVSHIKGAICVGYAHFDINRYLNTSNSYIPKDAQIIVYCSIGARSQTIGETLKEAGYTNVRNLYGGFFQWSNSGLPKYDNAGTITDHIHGYSTEWGKWITKGIVVY